MIKTKKNYDKIIRCYQNFIKPTHAMKDFEKATKKADEQRFPGIIVKGCLFHFGQYLFKNFVKHGFKTAYLENEEYQRW
jgi:hypothetical protein